MAKKSTTLALSIASAFGFAIATPTFAAGMAAPAVIQHGHLTLPGLHSPPAHDHGAAKLTELLPHHLPPVALPPHSGHDQAPHDHGTAKLTQLLPHHLPPVALPPHSGHDQGPHDHGSATMAPVAGVTQLSAGADLVNVGLTR